MARLLSSMPVGTKFKDSTAVFKSKPIIFQKMKNGLFLFIIPDLGQIEAASYYKFDGLQIWKGVLPLTSWLRSYGNDWVKTNEHDSNVPPVSYADLDGFRSYLGRVDSSFTVPRLPGSIEIRDFITDLPLRNNEWFWSISSGDLPSNYNGETGQYVHKKTSGGLVPNDRVVPRNIGYTVLPVATMNNSSILLENEPDADGAYRILWNQPPSQPDGISYGTPTSGESLVLSTGGSSDPEGDTITYIWERKIDSGVFTTIGSGTAKTLSTTVPTSGVAVSYRVKAADPDGLESAYTTGQSKAIEYNTPPTISGTDRDLGALTAPPSLTYTVSDAEASTLNVKVTVTNGAQSIVLSEGSVANGVQQSIDLTNVWVKLLAGVHTLRITATDPEGSTSTRVITFSRTVTRIAGSRAFNTENPVAKCLISVFPESLLSNPSFKLEVSNNPFDTTPVWEDVTSKIGKFVHLLPARTTKGLAYRFSATPISGTSLELHQVTIKFSS